MADQGPTAELDDRFSSEGASATPWAVAREQLDNAEIYWLSTVRPDGRPHVTPLIAVWVDDALHFCTGPTERKAKNLESNTNVVLTTGCNAIGDGLDIVVEGDARRVTDKPTLQRVADAYAAKYSEPFVFTVGDFALANDEGGNALVFEVRPITAFGFGKGDVFSQTRWRFDQVSHRPRED